MSIFEYAPAPESRAVVDIKESYGLFVNGEVTSGAAARGARTAATARPRRAGRAGRVVRGMGAPEIDPVTCVTAGDTVVGTADSRHLRAPRVPRLGETGPGDGPAGPPGVRRGPGTRVAATGLVAVTGVAVARLVGRSPYVGVR